MFVANTFIVSESAETQTHTRAEKHGSDSMTADAGGKNKC